MKADRTKVTNLLKTARGQMDGILKMVEDDRYCVDISNQILAVEAILRKVNRQILHDHIGGCVMGATDMEDRQKKLEEVMEIVDKLAK